MFFLDTNYICSFTSRVLVPLSLVLPKLFQVPHTSTVTVLSTTLPNYLDFVSQDMSEVLLQEMRGENDKLPKQSGEVVVYPDRTYSYSITSLPPHTEYSDPVFLVTS